MVELKKLALAVTSLSLFSYASFSLASTPSQVGMAMMHLNASAMTQSDVNITSTSLWNTLRNNFRINDVNTEIIQQQEDRLANNSAYFNRTIARSKPYIFHIAQEVKKRHMPAEIALLPFIESAFVTKAKSPVGASGLWQFMPATGRHYGLEKTALYDGRHDVYAATDAALNYLQYLYDLFGDWSLALAAYNWGEGNLGRAINRARAQGLDPVYENIKMPNETRNYVPKLLAVRNIINHPEQFGIHLTEIDNKPYFKSITINQPADISALARLAGISESEFLTLNPAFNTPVFVPKNNRKLLLPVNVANNFEKNYHSVDPKTLLSWDIYTSYMDSSLAEIAEKTGMSLSELKNLNHIKTNTISAGASILVAKNSLNNNTSGSEGLNFTKIDVDNTPDTYNSNMPSIAINATSFPKENRNNSPKTIEVQNSQILASHNNTKTVVDKEPTNSHSSQPIRITLRSDDISVTQDNATAKNTTITVKKQSISETDKVLLTLAEESNTKSSINNQQYIKRNGNQLTKTSMTVKPYQKNSETHLASNYPNKQKNISTHKVVAGDTLINISKRYNIAIADLITLNNITSNRIHSGQILQVKAIPNHKKVIRNVSYTVKKGDTLNTIANKFNINVNDIRKWNRNTRTITPGQKLNLMGS